jgi:hypothetical protein
MTKSLDLYAFKTLMNDLARAWEAQDTDAALACFHADAIYMQPPDQQYYRGHPDLKTLFAGLKPGTLMRFHRLTFDLLTQTGMGEFTFAREGAAQADHGMVVIGTRDGLIAVWREYLARGPADFDAFIATDGKDWTWHGGNLTNPPPGD